MAKKNKKNKSQVPVAEKSATVENSTVETENAAIEIPIENDASENVSLAEKVDSNEASSPDQDISQTAEAKSSENVEPQESTKEAKTESSAKGKIKKRAPEKSGTEETFEERQITDSEEKTIRERFKFDWELDDHIIEALDDALDEDATELSEQEDTQSTDEKVISFSQIAQSLFGLFVLVFSIIGVIATGIKVSQFIKAQSDNSTQLEAIENFIMPLVASDIPIFDNPSLLNEDVILMAACWDVVFNPSVYYEYSNGYYTVSYLDIDRRAAKLFGSGLNYSHKTVGDTELSFEYDEETGMYSIPKYPNIAYFPIVTSITDTDAGIEASVNYRLPIIEWIDSDDTVEKTMIYTLVPSDTSYNVVAVRIGSLNDEAEAT